MGSDLYMEQRAFHPRPNKAVWELVDGNLELVIYRDVFYHGWEMIWHGPLNEHTESLIRVFVNDIPPKPDVPASKEHQIDLLLVKAGTKDFVSVRRAIMDVISQPEPNIPTTTLKGKK